MKLHLFFPIAAALTLIACGPKGDAPKKALVGATLVDGTGSAAIAPATVVIDGGMIVAAGQVSSTSVPEGFEKINVTGKFIVPGLIDVNLASNPDLAAFLQAGITSVGVTTYSTATKGPRVFPPNSQQAGFVDLVVASNGSKPAETLAKVDRMAKAEINPLQIIHAATQNGAAWLGQTKLGAIRPGNHADLLVLDGDPLADIKNLRKIYRIMLDGHWVEIANVK